ncbi:radical SAM protein [Nannocystis sp. SCPEA4]|uniref:radical SAM protein n=1 Tax=Nannocystis sp. SCPEA4 TaxID=2996787 RepID=UPI00226F8953|nr:radical SAM protein [Nannocystis sp. SCPEA4]
MANLGYIQVVRHCNHFCGFCSNPATPYVHTLESMQALVDDLVARDYFGVILTGGEPTLHPELPAIAAYASGRGLDVRVITNGTRLADPAFARALADAGVRRVHVSIYSVLPDVEARLRGAAGTLDKAFAALDRAHEVGIDVHVNCVINRLNADHLDRNIRHFLAHHPYVRHFVWNNLDPSMGRAEVNQAEFVPRLEQFELSLLRAMRLLHASGRTFRVEKVPLCYMGEFAWASTETRKIVKGEERVVHFLDDKQTVRQTAWGHLYAPACSPCRLRPICGGLFDRGAAYDPAELAPQFVDPEPIVRAILDDPSDPTVSDRTLSSWRDEFRRHGAARTAASAGDDPTPPRAPDAPAVGQITVEGVRLYQARRRAEARKADALGVRQEPGREDDGA